MLKNLKNMHYLKKNLNAVWTQYCVILTLEIIIIVV